jgi:hypothetical protein
MARWLRRLTSVLLFLICVPGKPAIAADEAVEEIDTLNQQAVTAYRTGKAQVARRQLLRALVVAEDSGLTQHRVVARTYVNLGVVHLMALRNPREASNCFVHALQIAPNIRPTRGLESPRVKRALEDARRQVKRRRPPPEAVAAAAAPAPAPEPPVRSKPKEGLAADPAAQVGEPVAEAPAAPETPEAPAAAESETPPARRLASSSSGAGDGARQQQLQVDVESEQPPNLGPTGTTRHRAAGTFWLGLGVGSGVGAIGQRGVEHHAGRSVRAGIFPAGIGHVQPEVGLQLTPGLGLSLQSRHQFIPDSGGPDPAVMGPPPKTAHAVLACLYYRIAEGDTLQLLGTAAIGAGSGFRMKVNPVPSAMLLSSDTVKGGPVVAGPGLVLGIRAGSSVVVAPALRVLVGAPDLAAMVEGTLSLQISL